MFVISVGNERGRIVNRYSDWNGNVSVYISNNRKWKLPDGSGRDCEY